MCYFDGLKFQWKNVPKGRPLRGYKVLHRCYGGRLSSELYGNTEFKIGKGVQASRHGFYVLKEAEAKRYVRNRCFYYDSKGLYRVVCWGRVRAYSNGFRAQYCKVLYRVSKTTLRPCKG